MHCIPFRKTLVGGKRYTPIRARGRACDLTGKSLGAQVIGLGVITPLSTEPQAEDIGLEEASNAARQIHEQVRKSAAAAHDLEVDRIARSLTATPKRK